MDAPSDIARSRLPSLEEARALLAGSDQGRALLSLLAGAQNAAGPPPPSVGGPDPARFGSQAYLVPATVASFTLDEISSGSGVGPRALTDVLNDSLLRPAPLGAPQAYVLSNAARKATLEAWSGSEELRAALDEARTRRDPVTGRDDPETGYLVQMVLGNPFPPAQQFIGGLKSIDDMSAAAAAAAKLVAFRPDLQTLKEELSRRLEFEEIIGPLRVLINARSPVGLGGGDDDFCGREPELERLYAHVGVVPSSRLVDRIRRVASEALESVVGRSNGALVVHGLGGMGKSSLVAKFVLDHATAGAQRIPFAYLDFDRATLAGAQASTLLLETSRQVALQIPADGDDPALPAGEAAHIREELGALRVDIRAQVSRGARVDLAGATQRFRKTLDRFGGDTPFLLVLDTFERPQKAGSLAVSQVIDFLSGLTAGGWPRLRIVACGRNDAPELRPSGRPDPIMLGPLATRDMEELARRLLRPTLKRDPSRALITAVANAARGYPLIARTLSEQINRSRQNGDEALLRELDSPAARNTRIATVLYRRFAERMDVPGGPQTVVTAIVLRVVTPALLATALARENSPAMAQAGQIFADLAADRSLWAEAQAGSLRWRPELRLLLLDCVRADSAERVPRIARAVRNAALAAPPSEAATADALYYAALAGDDLSEIDRMWRDGAEVRHALVDASDDFPSDSPTAIYLACRCAQRAPTVPELRVLPASVGWRLALDGMPGLAVTGDKVVEARVLPLWTSATKLEKPSSRMRAERFALAAKIGAWHDTQDLFDEAILDHAVAREALLQWGARAAIIKGREEALAWCITTRVDDLPAADRAGGLVRRLVASLVLGDDATAQRLNERIFDQPTRLFDARSLDSIHDAAAFGTQAADWAIDCLMSSHALTAFALPELAILAEVCAERASSLAESIRSLLKFGQSASAGLPSGLPSGANVGVYASSLFTRAITEIRLEWSPEERAAAFNAIFQARDPAWVEPIGYALARSGEPNRPLGRALATAWAEFTASDPRGGPFIAGGLDKQFAGIADPIAILARIDETGLLEPFVSSFGVAGPRSGQGVLSRAASQIRGLWRSDELSDVMATFAGPLEDWRAFMQRRLRKDDAHPSLA